MRNRKYFGLAALLLAFAMFSGTALATSGAFGGGFPSGGSPGGGSLTVGRGFPGGGSGLTGGGVPGGACGSGILPGYFIVVGGRLVNGDGIQPGLDRLLITALTEECFSQAREVCGAIKVIIGQLMGRAEGTLSLAIGKDLQGSFASFLVIVMGTVDFFGLCKVVGQGVIILGRELL